MIYRPYMLMQQLAAKPAPLPEGVTFEEAVDAAMAPVPPAPPSPEMVLAGQLADLRAETERTILARYPEHTQRNMLARGLALAAEGKTDSEEAQELRAAWAWIEEQRAAYKARKAEIEA